MRGVLLGHDQLVADWAWKTFNLFPLVACRSVGIIENGKLVGAAIFTHYNGCDAHLSYYGKGTTSVGICRVLAAVAINELDLARATFVVPKRSRRLIKSLLKLGCKVEGAQRCFYGKFDSNRNTGVRLVMFRDRIEKIANIGESSDRPIQRSS